MESGVSRAEANKAIRQDALREQLANGKHVEHVIDMANKIADLDNALESSDIHRLKTASDIKLKLINKYLSDTKQVELQAELTGSVDTNLNISFVSGSPDSK